LLLYEHFSTGKRTRDGTRVAESISERLNGLQQILFISYITGPFWALCYLEDGQQFWEEGFEYRRGKSLA